MESRATLSAAHSYDERRVARSTSSFRTKAKHRDRSDQSVESPRFPMYATPKPTLFVFREERMIGSTKASGRQTAHGDEKAEDP